MITGNGKDSLILMVPGKDLIDSLVMLARISAKHWQGFLPKTI
jgi:hypothetical protein